MPDTIHWSAGLLLICALAYAAASFGALRTGFPLAAIAARWLRWLVFGLVFATINLIFDLLPHPFPVLLAVGLLLWFLIETVYNWLVISAISKSPLPLFPRFSRNEEGDEWPSDNRYIRLRGWMRANGFQRLASLKAHIAEGLSIRSAVYESEDGLTRLQILFLLNRTRHVNACLVFTSLSKDGKRIITDNINVPYGGFYPDAWFLHRHPLIRRPGSLLTRHKGHVSNLAAELEPWDAIDPVEDLNNQQSQLVRANTDQGFLNPAPEQEERGRISGEGRYRLWKEIWLLNYLGRTVNY